MKQIIFLIFLFFSNNLVCLDTLVIRALYHPILTHHYTLHKKHFYVSSEVEFFFSINRNKLVLPGLALHDSFLYKNIESLFNINNCTDSNEIVYYDKKLKHLNNIGHLGKDYYVGLKFYAFEMIIVVDSLNAKDPLYILDFNERWTNSRDTNINVKLPVIVSFLNIKSMPLKKHKLKRNMKIHPW